MFPDVPTWLKKSQTGTSLDIVFQIALRQKIPTFYFFDSICYRNNQH